MRMFPSDHSLLCYMFSSDFITDYLLQLETIVSVIKISLEINAMLTTEDLPILYGKPLRTTLF